MTAAPTLGLETRTASSAPDRARPLRLTACFVLMSGLWVILLVLDRLVLRNLSYDSLMGSPARLGLLAVTVAVLSTGIWLARGYLYRLLTSPTFASAILTVILLATVAGTFILQGQPAADYAKLYGSALSPLLLGMGLDDLFHTAWFNGFLFVLAACLILVVVKHRGWRMSRWGLLFSHIGTAVVLGGGLLGNLFGFKGNIGLHEGESTSEAVSLSRKAPGERRALGFSVRLEDFEMEAYEPEYRFYVYRHGKTPEAVKSFSLKEAQEFVSAGASGAEFRVSRVFPDFYQKAYLEDAAAGEGRPALRVRTGQGDETRSMHLFADAPGQHALEPGPGGCLIRFVWKRPTEEEIARFAQTSPERHTLAFREREGSPLEETDVQPGKAYLLGQGKWRLEVLSHFPDFFYNMETKAPGTRSQEPKNPALSVALQEPGSDKKLAHWLFAKMPDFGRQHGKDAAFHLTYRHTPARSPADRELLVVGETREVWDIEKGKVLKQTRLDSAQGPVPGAPEAEFRIFASAVERHSPATRSEEWKNPVVEIELRKASGTEKSLLAAEHSRPLRLPDGKTFLSFEPKPKEAKAYRSRLAVLEQSQKAVEQTIEVNHPLSYGGYKLYQSNYREDDPTYSGIQVVKDPGLPLVWAGLCMLSAGVVLSFYFWPRLPQRRYQ